MFHLNRLVISALWLGAVSGAAGCADPVAVQNDSLYIPYFTRYTLRGSSGGGMTTLYRSNYMGTPVFTDPGARVEIQRYSSTRINMVVNGIPCVMYFRDLPFPTTPEGIGMFLDKYFVKSKEELGLDKLTKGDLMDIKSGEGKVGMSKEEILMSNGYPSFIDAYIPAEDMPRERILESNQWIFRVNEIMLIPSYYNFQFGTDGTCIQRIP